MKTILLRNVPKGTEAKIAKIKRHIMATQLPEKTPGNREALLYALDQVCEQIESNPQPTKR